MAGMAHPLQAFGGLRAESDPIEADDRQRGAQRIEMGMKVVVIGLQVELQAECRLAVPEGLYHPLRRSRQALEAGWQCDGMPMPAQHGGGVAEWCEARALTRFGELHRP